MNRFSNDNTTKLRRFLKWLPLVMGAIVIVIFLLGVNYVSESSMNGQQESLENALTRDIAQCYAVEGTYPPSLDYIVEHYGLTYNQDLFFVDYQPIGGNLYPDITIICLNK